MKQTEAHCRRWWSWLCLATILCDLPRAPAFLFPSPRSHPLNTVTSAAFESKIQGRESGGAFTLELSSAEELGDILSYLEWDVNMKAETAREEEDSLADAAYDGERVLSREDWILEVESFWHHRDDITMGLGTCLSSIKKGGVLIGFVLISASGKKLDLLEVFRPRRGEGAGRFAVETFENLRISQGAVVLSIRSLAGSADFWQARGYARLPHAVGGPQGMLFKFPGNVVNARWEEVRRQEEEGGMWTRVRVGIRVEMGDNLHGKGSRGRPLAQETVVEAFMRREEGGGAGREIVLQQVYVCACYPYDILCISVNGVTLLRASLRRMTVTRPAPSPPQPQLSANGSEIAPPSPYSGPWQGGVEMEVAYVYSLRSLYAPP